MAAVMFGHLPLAISGLAYVGLPPNGAWQYVLSVRCCTSATSYFAYVAVLWARLSAPVAVVSSLCETSVMFAVVLGVLVLKERMPPFKLSIILTSFCGEIVLRMFESFCYLGRKRCLNDCQLRL